MIKISTITHKFPLFFDEADLWLLQNDPELAGKSAEYLLNKRIRDKHCLGAEFFDETELITDDQEENPHDEAFFIFVENQHWLNAEVKTLILGITQNHSLTKIGQDLGGISKQAVHKRLHKHAEAIQYLIKIWRGQGQDNNPPPQTETDPIPCFVDKNQQLAFDFGGAA